MTTLKLHTKERIRSRKSAAMRENALKYVSLMETTPPQFRIEPQEVLH